MIASGVIVYVSCQPVDFRKGAASLMALVRDGGLDPFNGALYVFRSKRADRVRIVWWDGSGVCLYSKTLEEQSFCWPGISAARIRLDHSQLMALLAGLDWKKIRPTKVRRPLLTGLTGLRQDESCCCNDWESGCFCALFRPMDLPLSDLPDDVDALKAMVLALAREQAAKEARLKVAEAEIARLEAVEKSANERIANLTLIMKVLQRTQNGKRSERLRLGVNDEQVSFAFEEVETGLSAIRSELDRASKDKPKRAPRPRKGFAAHLERIEEVIEPEIPAGCEGLTKVLIGEDRSERLDVVPPKFRVIVTRRPKYAFRGSDGVVQALAPAHIIEGGLPTERLLAYIAVSKYADGLPLYRQEAIYLRDGVEISRSLMAQWMGHLGFELQMLADYVLERVKEGERIFADETTLPTLASGSGKTTKAWLWAYARDDRPYGGTSPPMVAYRFEDSRGADCVTRHLAGFSGILQVDGYSAYTSLAKTRAKTGSNETIQLAGCWAHLRRKFYDLHISGVSQAATDTVLAMTELWRIEDEVRGNDADTRVAGRQEKSSAIIASLFELWEKELGKVSGKPKTAEAIRYALTRREALERFLTDGRIEIDSNIVERAIRPQTITRNYAKLRIMRRLSGPSANNLCFTAISKAA